MTKRLKTAPDLKVRINELDYAVLRHLSAGGAERASIPMSIRAITDRTSRNDGSIRRSLASLRDQGIILIARRYLENGGQLENVYQITELGSRVMHSVEKLRNQGVAS